MQKVRGSFAIAAFASALAAPASASVIFSDDFNRADNDTVGIGWTEIERQTNDVAISSNALLLRDNLINVAQSPATAAAPDAAATFVVSTLGYENLSLSFSWTPVPATTTTDQLWVSWRAGASGAWSGLFATGIALDSANSGSWLLAAGAADTSELYVRFWTNVGGNGTNDRGARIDNVLLSGEAVQASAQEQIPEPASLALLGLGLTALGILRRRI